MIDVQPFRDPDIYEIAVQPMQVVDMMPREWLLANAVPNGPVWTVRDMGGRIVCIAGLMVASETYATAWALVAEQKGNAMIALTRAIRRVLAAASWERIDMAVREDFSASALWARLLGFKYEAPLDGGQSAHIYVFERGN